MTRPRPGAGLGSAGRSAAAALIVAAIAGSAAESADDDTEQACPPEGEGRTIREERDG